MSEPQVPSLPMSEDLTATEQARVLIRDHLDNHTNPDAIPAIVAGQLTKTDLEQLALPWLNAAVKKYGRERVRRLEDQVFPNPDHEPAAPVPNPVEEYRTQLWAEGFSLNDGTYVLWGEATAEQHEQRAAEQRKLARAAEIDAARHEYAASMIRRAGVRCLNDIEAVA